MVRKGKPPRGLVVGNYCHDVIIRDGAVAGEGLGGAVSFVSNVLEGLSVPCSYVSKVGSDFAYSVSHATIPAADSHTAVFHAHFDHGKDRHLRRLRSGCSIFNSDLPTSRFDFGLAVGVAGEIGPQILSSMLDICRIVFVDAQALIRAFDPVDGSVGLVPLRQSGFHHLLPRIRFLKASAQEAPYIDIQEARRLCCVLVTEGEDGCRIYLGEEEMQIPPFPAFEIDPTGAGDSFLAGFAAGVIRGLSLPHAALLGNFFGSLTVAHLGLPKFNRRIFQRVNEELVRRSTEDVAEAMLKNSLQLEDFHSSLAGLTKLQAGVDIDE